MEFQSTLSLRRATPVEDDPVSVRAISIHALLAESDPGRLGRVGAWSHFNPRSPCGERRVFAPRCLVSGYFNPRSPCGERPSVSSSHLLEQIFQSTLSLRRATALIDRFAKKDLFQSTLSLRRATMNPWSAGSTIGFQSTLSLRRATAATSQQRRHNMDFNPRSPCGERQSPQTVREGVITYFNPRSPCGERLAAVMIDGEATLFQSTLSLRRATPMLTARILPLFHFNPRSPCGERRFRPACITFQIGISIHALLAESDPAH